MSSVCSAATLVAAAAASALAAPSRSAILRGVSRRDAGGVRLEEALRVAVQAVDLLALRPNRLRVVKLQP